MTTLAVHRSVGTPFLVCYSNDAPLSVSGKFGRFDELSTPKMAAACHDAASVDHGTVGAFSWFGARVTGSGVTINFGPPANIRYGP